MIIFGIFIDCLRAIREDGDPAFWGKRIDDRQDESRPHTYNVLRFINDQMLYPSNIVTDFVVLFNEPKRFLDVVVVAACKARFFREPGLHCPRERIKRNDSDAGCISWIEKRLGNSVADFNDCGTCKAHEADPRGRYATVHQRCNASTRRMRLASAWTSIDDQACIWWLRK